MIARDDPELLAFLRRLLSFDADGAARPDRVVGLVLADWLEERGDPRAGDVRAMAALRVTPVRPPDEVAPPEEGEWRPPRPPIWRWPTPGDAAAPWWDLLVEYNADGSIHVRWHADPYSDPGRALFKGAGRYSAGHVYEGKELALALDHCLAELIAATLGWSERALRRGRG